MRVWPSATTRLVALIGWPVDHSLSPALHNAAFREQELDLVYVALPTPPGRLELVVRALGETGAVGANVTVPHKQAVLPLCDRLTDEAELVGAVNTLAWGPGGVLGENTDAAGLEQVLRDEVGVPLGSRAVVLGTGGAARACAVACGRLGLHTTFVGRRPDAADDLARLARQVGAPESDAIGLGTGELVREVVESATLVANATPLGMEDETLPEPFQRLAPGQIAYDLVYRPNETPFLRAAHEAGAETAHGLGMLVAQAAVSYERWTGQPAPTGTMSAAALAALRG